jgi:hypothetical protein
MRPMPSPAANPIVLDTLGKLEAHGHGIGGYCLDCRRLFAVSLALLMLDRGRDCSPIRMAPLRCLGCGGRRTQYNIIAGVELFRVPRMRGVTRAAAIPTATPSSSTSTSQ